MSRYLRSDSSSLDLVGFHSLGWARISDLCSRPHRDLRIEGNPGRQGLRGIPPHRQKSSRIFVDGSNDHDCMLTISLGKGEEKSCQWKPRLHLFWGTMKRPKRAGLARVHWPHLTAKGHWAPWWGAARRTWFCFWLSGFWAPPIEGLWSCSGSGGRASTEWVSG